LILQAKRRQEQARVRLMNLEVARRVLFLIGAAIAMGLLLLGLVTGEGFLWAHWLHCCATL